MELSRFFSKDWYSRLKHYVESPEFEEIAWKIAAERKSKTNEPKTLYLLQNPEDGSTKTSFEKEPFYIVVGERKTTDVKVKCVFLSGADEPLEIQDWAGKYLPIVIVVFLRLMLIRSQL